MMNNRAFRVDDNSINSFTPSYAGTHGAIATHSNLSATTAHSILKEDKGNAFDAAAGAMLVESLVNPQMFGMGGCLLYTSPSPRDLSTSRMPSSA